MKAQKDWPPIKKDTKEPFERLMRIIEALPHRVPDEQPLSEAIPGLWPTVGDLRRLLGRKD